MSEEVQKGDQGQAEEVEEISLDNIDEILAQEAPEFSGEMDELAASAGDFVPPLDGDNAGVDVELPEDKSFKKQGKILFKKFKNNKLFQVIGKLATGVRTFFWRRVHIIKLNLTNFYKSAILVTKSTPQTLLEYKKYQGSKIAQYKKSLWWQYSQTSRKEKALMVSFLVGTIIAVSLLYYTIQVRWADFIDPVLITSVEEVADQKWSYNIHSGTTPFLTAFPQPRHSYLFRKVVVNIRKRVASLREAMGAFQFFVEVDSKDATVELKSRETHFHDMIQRTVEVFTYETLQTEAGKDRLKEKIREELNKDLAQGWVKGVYIKSMTTKP